MCARAAGLIGHGQRDDVREAAGEAAALHELVEWEWCACRHQARTPTVLRLCGPNAHTYLSFCFVLSCTATVFRSLTLLAVTRCEQSGTPFGPEVLTPPFLAELVNCLSFGKFGPGNTFDTAIKGYGLDLLVSQCANTTLKDPKVGKNIPTVAKMTQGEVVAFAGKAAEMMRADGMNVLEEGQTLNYVRTPHRFELTLPDPIIIAARRAAYGGDGAQRLKTGKATSEIVVKSALSAALIELQPHEREGVAAADGERYREVGTRSMSFVILYLCERVFLLFDAKNALKQKSRALLNGALRELPPSHIVRLYRIRQAGRREALTDKREKVEWPVIRVRVGRAAMHRVQRVDGDRARRTATLTRALLLIAHFR